MMLLVSAQVQLLLAAVFDVLAHDKEGNETNHAKNAQQCNLAPYRARAISFIVVIVIIIPLDLTLLFLFSLSDFLFFLEGPAMFKIVTGGEQPILSFLFYQLPDFLIFCCQRIAALTAQNLIEV